MRENKPLSLTEGDITSTLLRFSIPFLFSSMLQSLYGAVDVMVVGQFASPAHMSAVSIGSRVMHIITFFIMSINNGGTIMIGQFAGAKDEKRLADTIGSMILVALGLSVILTALIAALYHPILLLLQTPAEAMAPARDYILYCCLGIPFVVGYNAVNGIYRGLGDSKTPLLFVAIACVVNVVFDLILIKGYNMGAAGAAIATSGSQALSLVCALVFMRRRGLPFRFSAKENLRWNGLLVKHIFKLGSPLALQSTLTSVSFMIIMAITNSMGVIVSAAVGVVDKIISFAMMVPHSASASVSAMTAQNIGAQRPDRARKCMNVGIIYSLIFGSLACLWAQISPTSMMRLFTSDAEVIVAGSQYLRAFSIDCILISFVFIMNAYFNGCGKSMFTMAHSVLTTFLIRIPVSYFLSRTSWATLFEIGLAVPLASFVSLIVCLIYLRKNKTLGQMEIPA